MLLLPPVPGSGPATQTLPRDSPSTTALTNASGIIPSRARPYTTPHQGPTCLKTISASRLPHLPPPGQPSSQPMLHVSWMMVPSMVYSPLQPPSIDQVHSGSIVIVVACWSDKVLQAVGCTMIRRSRDACLQCIAFSHARSCLGHWAS